MPWAKTIPATYKYFIYAILLSVVVVQIAELLLLQRKYDLFTGGFLQSYSYTSLGDRILFLTLSLWTDLFLIGALGFIWFRAANYKGLRPLPSAYNFASAIIITMAAWLALKYKVLSYFSDALNFTIIKNLGGGSLFEALKYASQELGIIFIFICLATATYLLGRYMIKTVPNIPDNRTRPSGHKSVLPWALASLLMTLALIIFVNADPELRYGMKKKTSFYLLTHILNPVSDVDGDGFGELRFPTDPAPFDSSIHPGAFDIPNNDIDEDGYGGDFILSEKAYDSLQSLQPRPGQHILLFFLESTRWDVVGKELNGQIVAPNIMDILRDGSAVPYAYSHTGYTSTSIKATFNRTLSTNPDRITLLDFLRQAEYQLSFISGQDESFADIGNTVGMDADDAYLFDARTAIDDRVYSSKDPASLKLSEERIVKEFKRHTAELDWTRPQFIYVNLQAAHFPYHHPSMPAIINDQPIPRSRISKDNKSWLEATYWNAISNADWAIGEMLEALRMQDVHKDTLVVIMGDHGESLFDDNFLGHGHALNEDQTHIPLIINQPGIEVQEAVGQIDIAELVVSLATDQYNANDWQDTSKAAFQMVGPLGGPQLIGNVRHGEIRTILDLRMRQMYFSDSGIWMDFDDALNDAVYGERTRNLLQQWETFRWLDYQSKHGKYEHSSQGS